eukprot:835987-Prymnesium_polylepis.1
MTGLAKLETAGKIPSTCSYVIDGKLRKITCTLCRKPGKIGWFKIYNKMERNNRKWNICKVQSLPPRNETIYETVNRQA